MYEDYTDKLDFSNSSNLSENRIWKDAHTLGKFAFQ